MKAEKCIEFKKGLWTEEEDRILMDYIRVNGKGKWNRIPRLSGLRRSGKSCRLRWLNYLSPNVKRDDFSESEDDLIIRLHKLLGNRWSLIAGRMPGRTDNQVKNHWNTHLCRKLGLKKQVRKGVSSSSKSPRIQIQDVHTVLLQPDDNSDYQLLQETKSIINIENPLFGVGQPCNGEEEQLDADSPFFYNDYDDLFNLSSPGTVDFLDLNRDNF